ncbi:MAG: glycosyltransferase [Mariniblastus sp.]|nr:glycosyltransferase [Mariniblastus sp.]
MNVNHFNTFPYGGAAAAAKRLHRQMLDQGTHSRFLYHQADRAFEQNSTYQKVAFLDDEPEGWLAPLTRRFEKSRQRKIHRGYDQHVAGRPSNLEVFSMAELPVKTRLDWPQYQTDIVHLHWMAFFIDYASFFASIPDAVPIVWTLHDMNPLTGGCHYSGSCHQYTKGCGHCPQLADPCFKDVSRQSFSVKQKALRSKKLTIVTPSKWLRDLAKQSPIWPQSTTFHVIRLGFELDQYQVVDKQHARQKLGLETDAVLVGFGAEDINNERKGFHHLLPALEQLAPNEAIECLVFGSGQIPVGSNQLPSIHHFGYIDSLEKQTLFYSACDIVVVPSREDNQPQIGLEAMACGTPVIGFDAGGIPEYVLPEVTGLLAELGNETDLANKIAWLAEQPMLRRTMGDQARKMMEAEFDIRTQTEKYLQLYTNLLSHKTSDTTN